MGHEQNPPHVLFVSFPGQGHLNPLLRLAKRVAAAGLLVTFSTTISAGQKIQSATSALPGVSTPIGSGHLRFAFFSDGTELLDPSLDVSVLTHHLNTIGSSSFSSLLRRQSSDGHPVSFIVNNPFIPWVLDIARDFQIPCAVLWVQSCAVFAIYYHYHHSLSDFPTSHNPNPSITLPGLPPLTAGDIPTFLLPSNAYPSLTDAILSQFKNISKATFILLNTFDELEHDVIHSVSKLLPVIPVGPLIEDDEDEEKTKKIRGDQWEVAEECMGWLDEQEAKSVVYVSLGSIVVLTAEEMEEMATGLKNTCRPFLWVVREELEKYLPEGYVEETKGKGMVVRWSPQDRVLGHEAVACFVSHCGWNSTLETIAAGVPVVAYPQWGDQVTDAKFLVDVYGVGVRMRAPVRREEVVRCVEEVVAGKESEKMRKMAGELKEKARRAIREGGSSFVNVKRFVDGIATPLNNNKIS
ncbi:putative UDP-glucuronosyl/UDP-glucosyltransferase, UDP-glycosyltransferase family [Dioscorea sansibarensis]